MGEQQTGKINEPPSQLHPHLHHKRISDELQNHDAWSLHTNNRTQWQSRTKIHLW
jgi:hypothetical protein